MSHLPKVVADLITAQNNFDSMAYSHCFAETAIVYDEGKTYNGRKEIKDWIEEANRAYKTLMQPIEYLADKHTLRAEISGSFPGSPLMLTYHFDINGEEIHSLKIT